MERVSLFCHLLLTAGLVKKGIRIGEEESTMKVWDFSNIFFSLHHYNRTLATLGV